VELTQGELREVVALAYVVERAHPSYAGALPLSVQARIIKGARGLSGINLDYLISTLRHLAELGIRDRDLERLLAMIGPHTARTRAIDHASPSAATMLQATRRLPVHIPVRGLKLLERRRFLYRQQVAR
jgi:cation transport protein ChaC